MLKESEIKIGNVYIIQNSKHSWNNKKKVVITGKTIITGETGSFFEAYDLNNPKDLYLLDIENLK